MALDDVPKPAPRATDAATLAAEILEKLTYAVGKDPIVAQPHDWLAAVSLAVRDRIIDRWIDSTRDAYHKSSKRVYYLSLEFLVGRLLLDAMSNLGLVNSIRSALNEFKVDLDHVATLEPDAALGNGGLGRLAACFMESMASVDIPAYGYGIRYVHGLFRQKIKDGNQIELPEDWLSHGNPWEFERRESAYEIGFGGSVESSGSGELAKQIWRPQEKVLAIAYDTPIAGWRGKRVNTLRLWSARSPDPIQLEAFNRGDHIGALAERDRAEVITRVLYPANSTPAGQELRLRQEYFFVSASLQDLVRRHVQQFHTIHNLPDKVAIQLNDTHPAIAVAEMMRLLVDHYGLAWADAWEMTRKAISYTNHTLLPEALESWPVSLFERLLPRHMQIVYAINARLLKDARDVQKATEGQLSSLSLIDEHNGRRVRMGQLAFVGSHKVNGVSALHTELMKETVFHDLNQLFPDRICNKTNGITPRRWLMQANPRLTRLIRDAVGDKVLDNIDDLTELNRLAMDAEFQRRFAEVKRANKADLARLIQRDLGIQLNPSALFDIHIKRIHEYKRQLLNILATIATYESIRSHPEKTWVPRVKIFGGKAAASYWQAKLIIKLANDVAKVINNDPAVHDLLKVGVRSQLQCEPCRDAHSGCRSLRANFDGRHGSLGHRQYEVRAQRRPHHRHARRRQYRNPRSRGRRQYRDLRAYCRRSRRAPAQGARPARDHREQSKSCAKCSMLSPPAYFRQTIRGAMPGLSISSTTATGSWWWPTSPPISKRRPRSTGCGCGRRNGMP